MKIRKQSAGFESPTYQTVKEIIVKGAKKGGDKRQFVFLDKKKNECERSFNQTWNEIAAIGTFFYGRGLDGKKKIAIIGENCFEWMVVYYATLVGCNLTVPMDCKLPEEDLADQLIRCGCDALVKRLMGRRTLNASNIVMKAKTPATAKMSESNPL